MIVTIPRRPTIVAPASGKWWYAPFFRLLFPLSVSRMSPRGAWFPLLFVLPLLVQAVPELSYRGWDARDGVPDDRIMDIVQDPRGYLVIATYSGIARFDGLRFVPVNAPELPTAGRARTRVLYVAKDGGFWAGLHRGEVVHWTSDRGAVYGGGKEFAESYPSSMCEDGHGGMLVGFMSGGLARIADGKFVILTPTEGPKRNERTSVCRDAAGTVWVADRSSLFEYNRGEFHRRASVDNFNYLAPVSTGGVWVGEFSRVRKYVPGSGYVLDIPVPEIYGLVTVVHEDRSGMLWVGTRLGKHGGLLRLQDGQLEPVGIPDAELTTIMDDNEGNIWVGSVGNGIKRIQPRLMRLVKYGSEAQPDHFVTFALDRQELPWIVLRNGRVIRQTETGWESVPPFPNDRNRATTIVASEDEMYIGTGARGVYRWKNGKLEPVPHSMRASNAVLAVAASATGDLWISYHDGTIRRLRDGQEKEWRIPGDTNSRVMSPGNDGTIYVAAGGGKLYHITDGALAEVPVPEPGRYAIRALQCEGDGTLWLGFSGGGLGRLKGGSFARITVEHGLLDNFVTQLVKDRKGMLWMASNRGTARIDPEEFDDYAAGGKARVRVAQFPMGKDLQISLGAQHTAVLAPNGDLWFGGQTALLVLKPDVRWAHRTQPSVILEGARVDGWPVRGELANLPALELPPRHSKLEIEYTMPTFSSPENVDYRVWMEGFEQTWSHVGKSRQAVYSRLPAGSYRFRAAACGLDGVWSESAPLAIVVAPFFWQTVPFGLAVLGGAIGAGALVTRKFMQRRIRRQMQELEREQQWSRERARIARDMHDDLGSSLIHLALLGDLAGDEQSDAAEKNRSVGKMAEMARHLAKRLHEVVWSINPEHDTLTAVANYLGQYTSDLLRAAGIVCVLDIPGSLPNAILTSSTRHHLLLAAREGLNNVIRHSKATEVSLSIELTATMFVVKLRDNGCGFDAEIGRPGGNGLGNMRKRLDLAGGRCTFEKVSPCGTRVIFEVPLALKPSA